MLNKKLRFGFLVLLFALLPGASNAVTASSNNTMSALLNMAGCGTGNQCYMQPSSNTLGCTWANIYFDASTAAGKGIYAAALVAIATGKQMTINYNQDSTGLCNGIKYAFIRQTGY